MDAPQFALPLCPRTEGVAQGQRLHVMMGVSTLLADVASTKIQGDRDRGERVGEQWQPPPLVCIARCILYVNGPTTVQAFPIDAL